MRASMTACGTGASATWRSGRSRTRARKRPNPMFTADALLQVASGGLLMGAAYALMAIGFTIVFGVMNIVNFAHGHVVMAAMFASYCLNVYLGLDPYLAALALVPVFLVVGALLYRVVIAPIVDASHAAQMVATIALLIIIE